MNVVAFDTETALIRPGVNAPEMVCLSWQEVGQPPQILHANDSATLPLIISWLTNEDILLVGHEVAYDQAVIAAKWPHLLPLIFEKYAADKVTDTKFRMQLLDIAANEHRGHRRDDGTWRAYGYSLDDCIYRVRNSRLDKDTWRLRYGSLLDIPLRDWPDGARQYPLEDARATLDLYLWQEKCNR